MRKISRQQAKSRGLKRYFTGKTCPHGHMSPKLVSNGRCTACALARTKTPEARAKQRKSAGQKRRWKAGRERYKVKHALKIVARRTVSNALRDKRLIKLSCVVCGDPTSEAHHADYTKPLKVKWLCRKHHDMEHDHA